MREIERVEEKQQRGWSRNCKKNSKCLTISLSSYSVVTMWTTILATVANQLTLSLLFTDWDYAGIHACKEELAELHTLASFENIYIYSRKVR